MADTKTSAETAASALDGTELVRGVQGGLNVKILFSQVLTYISAAMKAAANTWAAAQTFTLAPVFTDASGTRTALGLGTAALKATSTSGNNVPLMDGANTWSAVQTFAANVLPNGTRDLGATSARWNSVHLGRSVYFDGAAPSGPQDGEMWFDGTALKVRISGVTKTVTVS